MDAEEVKQTGGKVLRLNKALVKLSKAMAKLQPRVEEAAHWLKEQQK